MFDELIAMLNDPETEGRMRQAAETAREKYKPLSDWRKSHTRKPKTLIDAVIQRESYKAAYEKVYGAGNYDAL